MPQAGYDSVSVPKELLVKVQAFVEDNRWGYRSKAEVVKAALREFLARYQEAERKP